MAHFKRPYELRNIKDNPDGYQIQFIVKGKSHSAFEKDLEKAKKIRDKMERKLGIIRNGAFRTRPSHLKLSFIPGTNKPMAPGISLRAFRKKTEDTKKEFPRGYEVYEIVVNWKDHSGKARVKTFYGCTETCYQVKKMKAAYDCALTFRKAYEQAVIQETLEQFDSSAFNRKQGQGSLKKNTTPKKLGKNLKTRLRLRAKRR